MKRFLVLICLWLTILPNSYADSRLTISYIREISEAVQNADQDRLVVFDVDNVISAPSDLIGRPKARPVRRAVFKEYKQISGKQSKGQALQYFLENIAKWKPKHIIFIDDNPEYLNSVSEMCNRLKIKFTGFHYKAAVFDQDEELSPEIARLQLKTLDEKEIWITDSEAKKIIETERK
jgi:hypothetical protein